MKVKSIRLTNFRNYKETSVDFSHGKNIVIGDNAQGKTNLLEAAGIAASGKSSRTAEERELVLWGCNHAKIELIYEARDHDEKIVMEWSLKEPSMPGKSGRCQKLIKINGVSQSSSKALLSRFSTVTFAADDLKILRGGPKYRRDWLDSIAVRLRPSFHDALASYNKSVMQRNRLLKDLSEKGRFGLAEQDELIVWDKQLARFGTHIIKMRLKVLAALLPVAEEAQSLLSRAGENLSIDYAFRGQDETAENPGLEENAEESPIKSMEELQHMEDLELAGILMKLMKLNRSMELRRRQSLIGPHRDNLIFKLNGARADSFGSQGQQRSIVLSLKLAELKKLHQHSGEAPVLLLDDVLAELDEKRASLLLSAVSEDMQTILSTTHLSGINEAWLSGAQIMTIEAGNLHRDDLTAGQSRI